MKLPGCSSSKRFFLVAVICLASLRAAADDKLIVYAVNYPLHYFAARIAGEHAEVRFPAPADVDPTLWNPDEATVDAYRKADLVLLNGAGYAQWLDRASLSPRRQVDTSAVFAPVYIPAAHTVTPGHDAGGGRAHSGVAFTTWLDFYQATQQADAILQALAGQRPQYRSEFEHNYAKLKQELMALDLTMQQLVAAHPGTPLFVSRPVYQYLARRYELHLESFTWDAGVMPADAQWQQLVYVQEAFPAAWMIWEAPPIAEIRERLQSLGIGVVVFDPCANRPRQGDFMDVMKRNLENLKIVFAE